MRPSKTVNVAVQVVPVAGDVEPLATDNEAVP